MNTTAVVVAYEGGDLLLECVAALRVNSPTGLRIVVLDNASRDGSSERLKREHPGVDLSRSRHNLGFAGGVNAVLGRDAALVAGDARDVVVLVNQDCCVAPGWIEPLLEALADRRVAVAGGRILERDGCTLQHAGGVVEANGLTKHLGRGERESAAHDVERDVDYVTGALFAFTIDAWRRFGPFDEGFYPVYFEEVDFCVRARAAGLLVRYVAGSRARHLEGASSGGVGSRVFLDRYHRSRMRFVAKHLLVRGRVGACLRAEVAWLWRLRDARQRTAALCAYRSLPGQWLEVRRSATVPGR